MTKAEKMTEVIQRLNQIPWNQAEEVTPEAENLVREHIRRMRAVMESLKVTKGLERTEAYAEAQSAGYDAPEYDTFMDMLFDDVEFQGAFYREHLILAVASYLFWNEDRDLSHLENPWEPILELYEKGYTSSFDEDTEGQSMNVILSYRDGTKSYKLV